MRKSLRSGLYAAACLAIAGLVLSAVAQGFAEAAPGGHSMRPATGAFVRFDSVGTMNPQGSTLFPCQSAAAAIPCYGPDQIRAAYNLQPALDRGWDGRGRTIVIVGAFQDPAIQSDVAGFNAAWGLPATNLQVTAPFGLTAFNPSDPTQVGWAVEMAVDVEWAHVVAPGAAIHLVLARTADDGDMLAATAYAVRHNLGDVISQSFGEAETCPTREFLAREHSVFKAATERGISLVASSGDFGAAERNCAGDLVHAVSTPASDPLVTAVGGTRLMADPVSGAYASEVGWGDPAGASGGGFSTIYRRPSYQERAIRGHGGRGLPDVAWSADFYGAVIVRALGHFGAVFGTSAAAPQWAGLAAITDQVAHHRVGSLNKLLYRVGDHQAFHDVVSGSNSFAGFTGFSAGPGWDAVTGLGSPNADRLIHLLARTRPDEGHD